jgi:hypothetical protein
MDAWICCESNKDTTGFIAVDGERTPFDFPGASASLPTVEAKGILVGGYTVGSSMTQGFLFVDGLYVTLV